MLHAVDTRREYFIDTRRRDTGIRAICILFTIGMTSGDEGCCEEQGRDQGSYIHDQGPQTLVEGD